MPRWTGLAALALLSLALPGARCVGGPTRPPPLPTAQELLEEGRAVRVEGLAALVERTEVLRGLRFLRTPELARVGPEDPRLAVLREEATRRSPLQGAGRSGAAAPEGGCFPDFGRARAICADPWDVTALRETLARLLDQQHYPDLVERAPELAGDPGVALRSVLAASAVATARGGLGESDAERPSFLALEAIQVPPGEPPDRPLIVAAAVFLAAQRDREAPFRTPPVSTRQILAGAAVPKVPALALQGAPPALPGCRATSDESVGVGRLLAGLARTGGSVSGPLLASWRGDRAVRFTCLAGERPWLYVAELEDASSAQAFARAAAALLPDAFASPLASTSEDRRAVLWHQVPSDRARGWATSLAAAELRIDSAAAPGALQRSGRALSARR